MKPSLPLIHAITNPATIDSADFTDRAISVANKAGAAIHLRSRIHGGRHLFELANCLKQKCPAAIFINDRVDIAKAISADGIHIPSMGIPTGAVRDLVGHDTLIGRSTHNASDALAAHSDGADYVFLGPIWPTDSHPGMPGIGLAEITRARDVSVIAIGGVTADRVSVALDAGAHGVAAISAIWDASDPAAEVERMLLSFQL